MRLRRLQIQRYGHFTDALLEFPGNGVQVIHGCNEAGKSTLLQFIRELLFGFGERNRYAFQGEKLEGAALLEFNPVARLSESEPQADRAAGGVPELVELKRRKGRPDAITLRRNDQSESFTESQLQALLGGANAPLFHNVFAFGLSELAEGQASLQIEAVHNALHGSGLTGMANPQKLLDLLTKDAEAIFKERGSKQDVATICTDIKNQTSKLKEKITRTETWLQRKRDHEAAKSEAEQLAAQLQKLRTEHARIKKLATAYPVWRDISGLQSQRQELGDPSRLASDSRQKFEKALDELKRLAKEASKLEREINSADGDLQKNPAQTEWLALRAEIEQARESIKSVQDVRRDLPLLETELAASRQEVSDGVENIISTWSTRQVEEFRCDAAQRNQCDELAQTKRELDDEGVRLAERETDLARDQAENQADLQSIGELHDITALQALLSGHADHIARTADLTRLLKEQSKQQRAIAKQTRELTPPLPANVTDLTSLPVPPLEQIKQFQMQFAAARQRVTIAEQSLAEAQQRCEQLERELAVARGGIVDIPTQDGLREIRQHRDEGWDLIQQRYIDGKKTTNAETTWLGQTGSTLPAEFERTLHAADDYSDRLFNNASLVHQQEQVTVAQQAVRSKQSELETQQQTVSSLDAQWLDLWRACGFVPFAPEIMVTWRSQYDRALELISKQADLQDDLDHLQQDIQSFNDRLASALPDFTGTAEDRLAAAQQQVARHQQQAQDLKSCTRQAAKLDKSAEQLAADRQSFATRQQKYVEQWQAWLAAMKFPADWQPDLAVSVVNRLQGLRDKQQQIPGLEGRINAMRSRLSEFDPFVARLCSQVAPEWQQQPTEVAARHLADRLQAAIDTDSRRTALTRELHKHRQKLEEVKEQQLTAQAERSRLLELAGAADDPQFLLEADRADTIRDVDQQILTKQRELARLRDFEDEGRFLTALEAVDYPALEASRASLEQQIEALQEEERKANERTGATGRELEQLDGSAAAAEIQNTISQRRAALANAVDRYVPLLFAKQLLQQTLQRFEQQSQPQMLGDVSRLFQAMTGGRYVRVERPRDENRPLIVFREGSTDEFDPSQLSTGTRELLFLAIRLAYVLHYCTKAEPLPIVLDDVFANFDPPRTKRALEALGQITDRVQVLLFTCHPHVVGLAREVFPGLQPVEMPGAAAMKA